MASPNVPSIAHLQPIGRDNSQQAELEASLEAALFSASCRAAFTWAVEQLEAGTPKLPDNQLLELHRLVEEIREHNHTLSLHMIQMPRLCVEAVSKVEEGFNSATVRKEGLK